MGWLGFGSNFVLISNVCRGLRLRPVTSYEDIRFFDVLVLFGSVPVLFRLGLSLFQG